jgi:hypothetical protein
MHALFLFSTTYKLGMAVSDDAPSEQRMFRALMGGFAPQTDHGMCDTQKV